MGVRRICNIYHIAINLVIIILRSVEVAEVKYDICVFTLIPEYRRNKL